MKYCHVYIPDSSLLLDKLTHLHSQLARYKKKRNCSILDTTTFVKQTMQALEKLVCFDKYMAEMHYRCMYDRVLHLESDVEQTMKRNNNIASFIIVSATLKIQVAWGQGK